MKYCKNCRSQLNETNKFCPKCGAPVVYKETHVAEPTYSPFIEVPVTKKTTKGIKPLWAIVGVVVVILIVVFLFFKGDVDESAVADITETDTLRETVVLTWQEQYDLGMKYLSKGNYEEAVIAFTAAIELEPKKADAYIGLADTYIAMDDIEAAIEILHEGFNITGDTAVSDKLELIIQGSEEESEPTFDELFQYMTGVWDYSENTNGSDLFLHIYTDTNGDYHVDSGWVLSEYSGRGVIDMDSIVRKDTDIYEMTIIYDDYTLIHTYDLCDLKDGVFTLTTPTATSVWYFVDEDFDTGMDIMIATEHPQNVDTVIEAPAVVEEVVLEEPGVYSVYEDDLSVQLAGTTWKLDYMTFYEQNNYDAYAVFGSLLQQSNILSFEENSFFMAAGGAGAAGGGTGTYQQSGATITYEMESFGIPKEMLSGTWRIVDVDGETMIFMMYSSLYEAGFTNNDYVMYWIQQ